MAEGEESNHLLIAKTTTHGHMIAAISRWPPRRKVYLRRRKLPSVRLGGKKTRGGAILLNIWRKMRLRWLKLQYSRMLKKLKEHYRDLIKDIVDAGATLETFQQRILMETTCAVPVMGVSFNSFSSVSRARAVS